MSLRSGDTGPWRTLLRDPDPGVRVQAADCSPDGQSILVERSQAGGPREIGIVARHSGSFRALAPIDWRGSTAFFSPDGRTVAFDVPTGDAEWKRDIFMMAVEGGERIPAVVSPANDVLMGWSPNGNHLLFASNRSGTTDLWAAPLSNGRPHGNPERLRSWYRQRPFRRHDDGRLAVFQDASERSRHRDRLHRCELRADASARRLGRPSRFLARTSSRHGLRMASCSPTCPGALETISQEASRSTQSRLESSGSCRH